MNEPRDYSFPIPEGLPEDEIPFNGISLGGGGLMLQRLYPDNGDSHREKSEGTLYDWLSIPLVTRSGVRYRLESLIIWARALQIAGSLILVAPGLVIVRRVYRRAHQR